MKSLVRPELSTAALRSSQATLAAVDNSAPLATRPQSTYKSGNVVQTTGATSLGMNKVVSEDALRRALERIDETASTAWMRPALMHSVREALDKPWVLDID